MRWRRRDLQKALLRGLPGTVVGRDRHLQAVGRDVRSQVGEVFVGREVPAGDIGGQDAESAGRWLRRERKAPVRGGPRPPNRVAFHFCSGYVRQARRLSAAVEGEPWWPSLSLADGGHDDDRI